MVPSKNLVKNLVLLGIHVIEVIPKKYCNRAGTKMKPEIDQNKVETLVVIDHEIQRLM